MILPLILTVLQLQEVALLDTLILQLESKVQEELWLEIANTVP